MEKHTYLRGERYRLQLCQDSTGDRYFKPIDETNYKQGNLDKDTFFVTEIVDQDLLEKWHMIKISLNTKLSDGGKYVVDAHGTWLTPEEERELKEYGLGIRKDINWVTPLAPRFASR